MFSATNGASNQAGKLKVVFDWKKALGIAVALVLLYLSFRKVDFAELWDTLLSVNWLYLLVALGCAVGMNWAKGMRWRALIRDYKPIGRMRVFALFHVGQMINLSLPALTGQAGRIVMLSKLENLSKTFCFTTVAMEVLFDGISLIILVYAASFIFKFPLWIRQAEIYAAIAVAIVLIVGFVVWRNQRALEYWSKTKLRRRFPKFYTKLESWMESISHGLASLKSARRIFEVSYYSLLVWLFHVMIAVMLILAFDLKVAAWAGIVVVIVNSFLLMVPISPGNIGSFQFIVIGVLHEFFNVPKAEAGAFSIVLHFMDIFPVFMIGIFFLFTSHFRFRKLRAEAEREAHDPQYVP